MAHTHCMVNDKYYRFLVCNTHYFSTATMVTRLILTIIRALPVMLCLRFLAVDEHVL